MAKQKKKKNWIKFRHRVVRKVLCFLLTPYFRVIYKLKVRKFKEEGKRQYFVMMNHQTPLDQFFVMKSFKQLTYCIASEDLFSNGWKSNFLRWMVAPIPIKKQTVDARSVLTCLRVAKEGATVVLAPEGNRTYSGKTEYMKPSVVGLARVLKLPVALYRIEGGYSTQPRWANNVRKGKMTAGVSRVIEPEEYANYTDEEFFEVIKQGLYVDDNHAEIPFKCKRQAEYLERALYWCPYCNLSRFESAKDKVKCLSCGREVRYLPTQELEGVGFELPFHFFGDWYEKQSEFMKQLDVTLLTQEPMWTERARMSEVVLYKNKKLICPSAELRLFGNRMEISCEGQDGKNTKDTKETKGAKDTKDTKDTKEWTFSFDEITACSVLGRNKLNVYHGGKVYQFKGDKRFNGLKFVHTYYRYQNLKKGEENEQFLGL